ncbi:uncharacterized protein LOC131326429 [Rhododendron vialii]|uniref:uncharacterized protein LOC131326429 n=1 Tax=Rhododendron vialii TaxID=182163 RepID=UPI0026605606|nr:uncharacterized protein LOC131326429 [Rhododendron vialii]
MTTGESWSISQTIKKHAKEQRKNPSITREVVPNAEMRFNTRHLYTSFSDLHKGMELKKQLWTAARATTVLDFHKAMEIMRSIDVEAYNWLAKKPATQWSRSAGKPKKSRRKERKELENHAADKLKRHNTSLRCGKCGQWGHNIKRCKNEVNPEIRRRPSGGLVFSRPTGKPRGRLR